MGSLENVYIRHVSNLMPKFVDLTPNWCGCVTRHAMILPPKTWHLRLRDFEAKRHGFAPNGHRQRVRRPRFPQARSSHGGPVADFRIRLYVSRHNTTTPLTTNADKHNLPRQLAAHARPMDNTAIVPYLRRRRRSPSNAVPPATRIRLVPTACRTRQTSTFYCRPTPDTAVDVIVAFLFSACTRRAPPVAHCDYQMLDIPINCN